MSLVESFRAEVEAFLARTKMQPTKFGEAAVSDPNFVFDLRKGRSARADTIDRVRGFMNGTPDVDVSGNSSSEEEAA